MDIDKPLDDMIQATRKPRGSGGGGADRKPRPNRERRERDSAPYAVSWTTCPCVAAANIPYSVHPHVPLRTSGFTTRTRVPRAVSGVNAGVGAVSAMPRRYMSRLRRVSRSRVSTTRSPPTSSRYVLETEREPTLYRTSFPRRAQLCRAQPSV